MNATHATRRLLVLTWDDGEHGGGLGRAMRWIASALRREGIDAVVASPFSTTEMRILRITQWPGGHILFSLLLAFVLPRLVRRHGFTDLLLPASPGGIFLFYHPKKCTVHAVVDHLYAQQWRIVPGEWWKILFVPCERRTLACADHLFCVSPDTARALKKFYNKDGTVLIPHAFDSVTDASKDHLRCMYVARLTPRKGIDVLLAAWSRVVEKHPNARLTLVGDGPLRRLLDDLPATVRASIDWHPSLPHDDVLALFDHALVSICTGYLEGFCLACAEGMNAACAPVICDSDGLRFFIENDSCGIVVPQNDAKKLADAINSLLDDHARARVMGNAARASLRRNYNSAAAQDVIRRTVASVIGASRSS